MKVSRSLRLPIPIAGEILAALAVFLPVTVAGQGASEEAPTAVRPGGQSPQSGAFPRAATIREASR